MSATDETAREGLVPGLSPTRSELVFPDAKPPLTPAQARLEAHRCLFCSDAPCVRACPTAIDIPQFIRKIATGNVEGAARTIAEANVLGASCARVCPVEVLCAGACVYHALGEAPIAIGRLQRYAMDGAIARGMASGRPGPDTGKSVGLVGGGPASLAAAHRLRRFGHRVTIYEKRAVLGGLNTTGVAPHKLRADESLAEVDWVLAIGGIEVRTGIEVGRDVSLGDIEARHDAVLIGVGLGDDARLGVPGEDLDGVFGAVAWIERMKLSTVDLSGVRRCVVIGGGNTALDAAREARTLGIDEVTLLYRGTEATMSGYAHEWRAAKIEGVKAEWRWQPMAFEADASRRRVAAVRCQRCDDARRPIAAETAAFAADLVLVAIGQTKLGAMFNGFDGIVVESGRIQTDAVGRTGRPGWFAAGDCANGGKEVVHAVAEGERAARAIDAYLRGEYGGFDG